MKCIHLNIRKVSFILLSMLVNFSQLNSDGEQDTSRDKRNDSILHCPPNANCTDLPAECLECDLNPSCRYGQTISIECKPKVNCNTEEDNKKITKSMICRYCYQTEHWEHSCDLKANCISIASPRTTYATNCTVNRNIICLGNRTFNKNLKCNWTGGYRWSTALALSITLGGFGADRFYLGHWQEGIGKLFSFGGLGVWTIIDVILISLHYLGPADGSLYI